MNLDHDFVHVWKFSEDRKKNANRTLFSPNSGEDQKKKGLQQEQNTFFPRSPNLRLAVHPFKLLGGMQMWTILKLMGDTAKLLGGYIPHPPSGFGTTGHRQTTMSLYGYRYSFVTVNRNV